ncbi:MAG: 2Fe-2S iron-sulfur cluster-binding protein [Candidatus Midichloriaceae bacterium]
MPKIKFIFDDGEIKEVEAPNGLSIMEIAHQNDIYEIEGACGGSLSCATCHVVVDKNFYDILEEVIPKKEDEDDMLDLAFGLTKTSRLSCQIIMQDKFDGLTVKIPKER